MGTVNRPLHYARTPTTVSCTPLSIYRPLWVVGVSSNAIILMHMRAFEKLEQPWHFLLNSTAITVAQPTRTRQSIVSPVKCLCILLQRNLCSKSATAFLSQWDRAALELSTR